MAMAPIGKKELKKGDRRGVWSSSSSSLTKVAFKIIGFRKRRFDSEIRGRKKGSCMMRDRAGEIVHAEL